jgi:hypothetical protein
VPQRYLPSGQNSDNAISSLSRAPWRRFRPTVNCRLENAFNVTKYTKLQWLQYRINHHILVTNHLLSKVKIIAFLTVLKRTHESALSHIKWPFGLSYGRNYTIILQKINYYFVFFLKLVDVNILMKLQNHTFQQCIVCFSSDMTQNT